MTTPTLETPGARRVVVGAVLSGLCPLIPLPWVDDYVMAKVRQHLYRSLYSAFGVPPDDKAIQALAARPSRGLWGCLTVLVFYPIKKIFRKIFFLLAVKDAVDAASETLHEGLLLRHALEGGLLAGGPSLRLVPAVRATLAATDPRPLNQALRRAFSASRSLLSTIAATLGQVLGTRGKGDLDHGLDHAHADASLDPLVDLVGRIMFAEPGYLEALLRRFDAEWGRP